MIPVLFPQANTEFTSPPDLEGSCQSIAGHISQVQGGIFDGTHQVIVAWKPTEADLLRLNTGGAVYLSAMGGLPPHYLGTDFDEVKQ